MGFPQIPGRPPQFNIKAPCSECPFRVASPMRVRQGHMEEILDSIEDGHPFPCHKVTQNRGRTLNHPHARYCAGSMLYSLQQRRTGVHMQLAERLGLWSPDELSRHVPVMTTREAMLAHHNEG